MDFLSKYGSGDFRRILRYRGLQYNPVWLRPCCLVYDENRLEQGLQISYFYRFCRSGAFPAWGRRYLRLKQRFLPQKVDFFYLYK